MNESLVAVLGIWLSVAGVIFSVAFVFSLTQLT
jgi:hypothetical protein